MALWAVMVGGEFPGVRLECHDVLFALGETIEDCLPSLKAQWRGVPGSLHLDAWGKLDAADGHRLILSETPPEHDRVWFVHLGGYDPARFTELHRNVFVVARDAKAAKARGLSQATGWHLPHRDEQLACESVEELTGIAEDGRFLVPLPEPGAAFSFVTDYVPIG